MKLGTMKNMVESEHRLVRANPGCEAIQSYSLSGGGIFRKTWRTTGFFLEDRRDRRLVYELCHLPVGKVSVLRVYWDEPLTFLFAVKFSTPGPRDCDVFGQASRIFVDSAREVRPRLRTSEPQTAGMIHRFIHGLFSRLLSPVPPPIDLEDIHDAGSFDETNEEQLPR